MSERVHTRRWSVTTEKRGRGSKMFLGGGVPPGEGDV
jgi:hypothetical protein